MEKDASPSYRVYFWRQLAHGGYESDEFELRDAVDVREVLGWAEEKAEGRTFTLYVLVEIPERGLVPAPNAEIRRCRQRDPFVALARIGPYFARARAVSASEVGCPQT
jgi:hypothetical protein